MDIQIIKQEADELKDDLIGFCRELIRTPSMPGQEEAIAKLTVKKMEMLGYDEAYIDDIPFNTACVVNYNNQAQLFAIK